MSLAYSVFLPPTTKLLIQSPNNEKLSQTVTRGQENDKIKVVPFHTQDSLANLWIARREVKYVGDHI